MSNSKIHTMNLGERNIPWADKVYTQGHDIVRQTIELEEKFPGRVDLIIAKDQSELGIIGAQHLLRVVDRATALGMRVFFDMPTGSSPQPIWQAWETLVAEKVDLSSVFLVGGHEAELPPQTGTSLDYERQREEILQRFGISVQPITYEQALNGQFEKGNFIPMYLVKPDNPDDITSVKLAAEQSVRKYDKILNQLFSRRDIVIIGYHGVGPDSHGCGEFQLFHMWPKIWRTTFDSFVIPSDRYTPQGGLWKLMDANGGFDTGDNFVGLKFPDIFLMGLGRQHLLRLDHAVEIFDKPTKALALQRTLEALRGVNPGEGEVMLDEFKAMAAELRIGCEDAATCYQVFQKICSSLGSNAPVESFYPLWKLATRYFGSDTPVARVIRERAELGLPTTLLTTQEVYNSVL